MDPWGKLEWFFSIYTRYMENGRRLCLPGSVASEYYAMPVGIQEAAKGLIEDLLSWLKETLQEGRKQKRFEFEGPPTEKAAAILGSIQGALQLTRLTRGEQLQMTLNQIRNELTA